MREKTARHMVRIAMAVFAVGLFPVHQALPDEATEWRIFTECWGKHAGEFGRGLYELSESPSYMEGGIEKRVIRIRGCPPNDGFERTVTLSGEWLSLDFQALPLSREGEYTDFLFGFLWEEGPFNYLLVLAEDDYQTRTWINAMNGPYVVGDPESAEWFVHLMPGTTISCGASNEIVMSVEGPDVAVLDPRLCIRRSR